MLIKLRIKAARQLHGTQRRCAKSQTGTLKSMAQKGVIKTAVVCQQQATLQQRQHLRCQLGKSRRIRHHRIIDAGKAGDKRRNWYLRIHQPLMAGRTAIFKTQNSDFGNPVFIQMAAGGFQINNRHRPPEAREKTGQLRPMQLLHHDFRSFRSNKTAILPFSANFRSKTLDTFSSKPYNSNLSRTRSSVG